MKKFSFHIKNQVIKKRLKKAGVTLLVLLLFFGAIGVFLGYYYEDTVKKLIISELNKRLNTQILVENIENDIEFSIFKKFPFATVSFHNVKMTDAVSGNHKKGYLLEARTVYLQFSIVDLIFKNYRIKKVEIDKGLVNIKIFKDKTDNFHFWKAGQDSASTTFSFALQKVILKETSVNYMDYGRNQDYRFFTEKLLFKGKFMSEEYNMDIDGNVYVRQLKTGRKTYIAAKNCYLELDLYVNNNRHQVDIRQGDIRLGKMVFAIYGSVNYADTLTMLDLKAEAKKSDFQDFVNELPHEFSSMLSGYRCKGSFYFKAYVKGRAGNHVVPGIEVQFGLTEGEVYYPKNDIGLKNVNFNAVFTNGPKHNDETSELRVENFSCELENGNISGNFTYSNFVRPELSVRTDALLQLSDVFRFLKIDTVTAASGTIELHAEMITGIREKGRYNMLDFVNSKTTGTLKLSNGEIIFGENESRFSNLNGNFVFNNNDIETQEFSGKIKNSDFSISGSFRNILPYLVADGQKLEVMASFSSEKLDLGEMLVYGNSKKDTVYKLVLPENINFKLNVKIKHFVFDKFTADNIYGNLALKNRQFIAENINMKTLGGSISASGLIDGSRDGKLLISCDADLKQADISKMFYVFGNFGQKSLQDKNIKGLLTASIQFASVWSDSFVVEPETIYASADIKIDKGEIIDYEPLMGLSKYLKGYDLSHVKFETLSNTIVIKNKVITIPKMDINSDAIDIKIDGTHTFENQIDYHLSVLIAQIKKKESKTINEVGHETDDGLHKEKYFFRITGTVENPVYHTFDREGYKEHIKSNLKQEKENLKTILNREFGWFKKDSTLQKNPDDKSKDKYDFKVEWEEEEEGDDE